MSALLTCEQTYAPFGLAQSEKDTYVKVWFVRSERYVLPDESTVQLSPLLVNVLDIWTTLVSAIDQVVLNEGEKRPDYAFVHANLGSEIRGMPIHCLAQWNVLRTESYTQPSDDRHRWNKERSLNVYLKSWRASSG